MPGAVFITSSAATSLPSYHLTMMENSFFVFSTQRVVYLSIFLHLLVRFWQNQTRMLDDFEDTFFFFFLFYTDTWLKHWIGSVGADVSMA